MSDTSYYVPTLTQTEQNSMSAKQEALINFTNQLTLAGDTIHNANVVEITEGETGYIILLQIPYSDVSKVKTYYKGCEFSWSSWCTKEFTGTHEQAREYYNKQVAMNNFKAEYELAGYVWEEDDNDIKEVVEDTKQFYVIMIDQEEDGNYIVGRFIKSTCTKTGDWVGQVDCEGSLEACIKYIAAS